MLHCHAHQTVKLLLTHDTSYRSYPRSRTYQLFAHWEDLTNAERMNYWLSVLADNHLIATTILNSIYVDPQTARRGQDLRSGDPRR